MHATHEGSERKSLIAAGCVFLTMGTLTAVDLVMDLQGGVDPSHAWVELCVIVVGLGGAASAALRLRRLSQDIQRIGASHRDLRVALTNSQAESARWSAKAADLIQGVSRAIDAQLDQWALSMAEKEVARLLLKGLSHKEIAGIRHVSEATVRQQATSIYKKSGLIGRADLAAFFLEDLLGPNTPTSPSPPNT